MARNYLIYEDAKENSAVFDKCAAMVLNGEARITKKAQTGYPIYGCLQVDSSYISIDAVLKYYLYELNEVGFDYEKARIFSEAMRRIAGFEPIRYELSLWYNRVLRDTYFYKKVGDYFCDNWVLNPQIKRGDILGDYFHFAAYIALCCLKYGASYESVTANEIFRQISELGSDLPNRLKKYGSGDLPKEVTGYKDGEISCKANDAFATIDIKIKIESEENYAKALDFLNRLLENEFPRSYAISFRCPQKNFLPIKGLPKKSVHTFFANAAAYEKLHGKIERYANLAMRQYEWYNNLEDEDCAMPGSFAIFALGLFSESYAPLICKYLKLCDGEHSSIQAKFVRSYIEKYGFSKSGIDIFVECAANIQELEPHKIYAQKIANEQSLRLLLAKKSELDEEYIWNSVLYALWNVTSKAKIAEVIKSAPNELKDIYEEVLASNEKGSL